MNLDNRPSCWCIRIISACALVTSCTDTVSFEDSGGICLQGKRLDVGTESNDGDTKSGEVFDFEAGSEIRVIARLGSISNGCFRDLKMNCIVQRDQWDLA